MPGDDANLVEFERRQVHDLLEEYNLTYYQEYGLIICNNCNSAVGPNLTCHIGHCSKRPNRLEAHLLDKFFRTLKSPYTEVTEPLPHLPFKEVMVGLKCPYCTFYTKTWNVWMKHGNEVHGGLDGDNPIPCLIQCLYDIHAPSSMQVYYPVIPTDEAKALVKNYTNDEMEHLLGSLNLSYDQENNVLLCTICTTGVTKRLTNHLKLHGHYLSKHEYFLILFHCFREESIYWKKNDGPLPALPYIPVEDGLFCNSCNYATKAAKTMVNHIIDVHPNENCRDFSACLVQRINKAHPYFRVNPTDQEQDNVEQDRNMAEIPGSGPVESADEATEELVSSETGEPHIQDQGEVPPVINAIQHERRRINFI